MENTDIQPAIEGWFTMDPEPAQLIGTRCAQCSSYFFPKEEVRCRNPRCGSESLESCKLSSRGRIWSYTNACYQPPPPYIAAEDYTPFVLAAVELENEKMCVLGQMVHGTTVNDLKVGMDVILVRETLYEKDGTSFLTWKWQIASEGKAHV